MSKIFLKVTESEMTAVLRPVQVKTWFTRSVRRRKRAVRRLPGSALANLWFNNSVFPACFVSRIATALVLVVSFLDSQLTFCSMQAVTKPRKKKLLRGSHEQVSDIEYIIPRVRHFFFINYCYLDIRFEICNCNWDRVFKGFVFAVDRIAH